MNCFFTKINTVIIMILITKFNIVLNCEMIAEVVTVISKFSTKILTGYAYKKDL